MRVLSLVTVNVPCKLWVRLLLREKQEVIDLLLSTLSTNVDVTDTMVKVSVPRRLLENDGRRPVPEYPSTETVRVQDGTALHSLELVPVKSPEGVVLHESSPEGDQERVLVSESVTTWVLS